jgi:hypothetical protein
MEKLVEVLRGTGTVGGAKVDFDIRIYQEVISAATLDDPRRTVLGKKRGVGIVTRWDG